MIGPDLQRPRTQARSAADQTLAALGSAGALGAFSAGADWIWSRYLRDGAILPGLIHGVIVFVLLALVLGRTAGYPGATRRLLLALPVAGLVLAAVFYPLAYGIGYLGSLLVTWVAMWLTLALLRRWATGAAERSFRALARGLAAALGSGLAFWAVSGMWTDPGFPGGMPTRFLYWSFAFLPGFLALLLPWRASGDSRSQALS